MSIGFLLGNSYSRRRSPRPIAKHLDPDEQAVVDARNQAEKERMARIRFKNEQKKYQR